MTNHLKYVLYYGYPQDQGSLEETHNLTLTDDEFYYATQGAVWYFTDFMCYDEETLAKYTADRAILELLLHQYYPNLNVTDDMVSAFTALIHKDVTDVTALDNWTKINSLQLDVFENETLSTSSSHSGERLQNLIASELDSSSTTQTTVTVYKKWSDSGNASGKRPSVSDFSGWLELYQVVNGSESEVTDATPTITTNGNTYTIQYKNLATTDESGNAITYKVKETIPSDQPYTSDVSEASDGEIITNTLKNDTSDKVNVTVTKLWEDSADSSARPSTGIYPNWLILYKTVNGETTEVSNHNPSVSADGDTYTISYTDLPRYENNNEITYSVGERDSYLTNAGYQLTVTDVSGDTILDATTAEDGQQLVNTKEETTEISVKKIWDDVTEQEVTFQLKRYTLDSSNEKVEDTAFTDENHTLTLNSTTGWEGKFTDLPVEDSEGNTYIYDVEETTSISGAESVKSEYVTVDTTGNSGSWGDSGLDVSHPYSITEGDSEIVAYCFNLHKYSPSGTSYPIVISGADEDDLVGYADSERLTEGLLQKIKNVIYNGYPTNGSGLQDTYNLTDAEFRYVTQMAVYYYTDNMSFTAEDFKSKDMDMYNAYQALIGEGEDTLTEAPADFEVDLYVAENNATYQNLITAHTDRTSETTQFVFDNIKEQKKIDVSVYKKWADSGQETSRPSTDDVKSWFTLYDADGNVVDATPSIQVSDTDSTVYIVTYENLDPGSYTVKENVPASYNYATYYESGEDYAVASSSGMTTASTIINAPETSQETDNELTVTKVSSNNTSTKLSGAEFKLYSDAACTEQLEESPTLTTGTDGVVTISTGADYLESLLPTSDEDTTVIYLKETKAPDSYTASDTVYPIVLGQETTSAWNNDHTSYVTTKTHTIYYQKDTNVSSSDIQVENTPYTEIELKAQKTLSGANLSDKQFSFTLTAADENAKAALTADTDKDGIVTVSNDASGNISFGNLKFTEAGTYTYTIQEVLAGTATSEDPLDKNTNIQYDTAEHTAVVTVSQNTSDGTLSASVTYDGNAQLGETGPTFRNVYYAPVDYTLTAKKTLSGKTLEADEFSFTLTADSSDENYTAAKAALSTDEDGDGKVTVKNSADGTISFSLHFDQAGTYKYTLQEDAGSETGVTYDTAPHAVLIEVKAESGSLVPYVKYDNNENTSVTFSNEYFEPVSATIEAEKTVAGSGYTMKEGDFEFTLSGDDADSKETLEGLDTTVSNKEDGSVTFPEIQYTKKGTYSYTISEVIPSESEKKGGITYTTDTHQVTVTVSEDETSHKLTKTVTYDNGSTEKPVFQNTYASSGSTVITASKKLTGATLKDKEFTFDLKGTSENAKDTDLTAQNDASGNISFTLSYETAGTYVYELTEEEPSESEAEEGMTYSSAEYTVTVKVTDDGSGKLTATPSITDSDGNTVEKPEFENTYATEVEVPLNVNKALDNADIADYSDSFSFTLTETTGGTSKVITDSATVGTDGKVSFDALKFTDQGTHTYTITENLPEGVTADNPVKDNIRYDTSTHDVTIEVTSDEETRELTAKVLYDGSESNDSLTFTNTYIKPTDASIQAKKTLTGHALSGTEGDAYNFTFTLEGNDTASKATLDNKTVTKHNDAEGTIDFGEIHYTKEGIYSYMIRESVPSDVDSDGEKDGILYDTEEHTVEVGVTANTQGELVATVIYDNNSSTSYLPTFQNEYNSPAKAEIQATKKLIGKDLTADAYEFRLVGNDQKSQDTLKEQDGTTADAEEGITAKNDAEGSVSFGEITFTKAGTYEYTMTEVLPDGVTTDNPKKDGVEYDTSSHTVTVQVNKSDSGLTAEVTYDNNTEPSVFTNTYSASDSVILSAKKTLTGATLKDQEFSFTLTDVTDKSNPKTIDTAENNASGSVVFQEITYSQDDSGKKFYYTITEDLPEGVSADNPTLNGMTYDTTVHNVTVSVEDDGKGGLKVTPTYDDAEAIPEFKNSYATQVEVPLSVTKKLTNADIAQYDGKFSFALKGTSANALQTEITKSNDAAGNVNFGTLTYTDAGVYTYEVKEVLDGVDGNNEKDHVVYDDSTHTITVTVTSDAATRELSYTITYDNTTGADVPTFTNKYVTPAKVTLKAEKQYIGKDLTGGDFSFRVEGANEASVASLPADSEGNHVLTASNAADGSITFPTITYTDPGTYEYTISEVIPADADKEEGVTYDSSSHKVNVAVEITEENGELKSYVRYDDKEDSSYVPTFTNQYYAPVEVEILANKEMKGANLNEGDYSFTLTGNNAESKATLANPEGVTVSNAADGTVAFGKIKYTEPGTYTYTMAEDLPDGVDESNPSKDGVTYDTRTHTVTVVVSQKLTDGKGELTADVTYDGSSQTPVFSNVYAADGSVRLSATKKLTGSLLQDQQFQFRLQGSDDSVDQTVANDANGNITFDEIKYTKAGTYHYTLTEVVPDGVTETNPTQDNITYDLTEYSVEVQVEDGNDGTLNVTSVTYNGKSTAPVFTNHYAASVKAGIEAHKQLNNGTLEKGQFSFTLQGISENAKDFTKTVKNAADGTVDFGDIEYNEEGTYEYTIKENLPEGVDEKNPVKDGISYDTSTHYVTVVVTPGVEQLSATVMYDNSEEAAEPTFVNTESDSVDVQLEASKVLKNATLSAGEFSFQLTGSGENTEDTNLTASNDENGKVVFPHLTYDQAGTYRYKMSEIIPENKITGMTYDSTEHEVLVEVTMDNGVLKAYVVYDNSDIEKPVFTNEYNAPCDVTLKATKTLKNRTLKKNEFEFSLTDITDSSNPKELGTKRNDASGNVTFDEITYTKAGTYRYRIEEVIPEEKEAGLTYDTSVHTVVVQVTKNNGKLVPTVVYDNSTTAGAASFTNTYIGSISIPVEKTWAKGVSGESATVLLKQDGKQIGDSVELNEKNHWKHTFENLPKFTEDGHEYQYTVEETNSNYKVTVVQNDESDVSKGFTINNDQSEEKTELKVTKEWTDGASGEYAEVELYQDGNPTGQTERLTEDNDWTHTFTGLDKYGKDGHTIKYTVVENSDNYTIEYKTNDDGSITVVNSPKAGDIHTTVGVDGTKSTSDNELTVDYAKLTDQKGHVVDTVSYTGLNTSKTYTVVGRLMDVTDEDSETIVAQASKVFQPTETDGSVDVDFGEVALESGHKYVVYEYLYTGEIPDREENDKNHEMPKDETPTKEHQDKHDKSQTFVTVEIHTTVGVDGTKSTSDNELTVDYAKLTDQKGHVVDTVSYTGLDTTKTYTVVGRLMDVTDDSSEEIVAQASEVFQPTETDGSVDVDFGEVALESGHKYVVYEYLYTGTIPDQEENDKKNELPKDETPTAEHHDQHDKSQTFVTVEIHTTVGVDGTKSTSDNELTVDYAKLTDQKGHVVDTVSYTGLDTTKTYTVVGRLMDVTDDSSEEIVAQASEVFQPTETDGSVDVDFGEVALESGHTYVVYEYLYTGEIPGQEENDKKNELPKDETPTAEHHDQHDKSQTFVTVEIHTTVGVDGTKSTSAQELTVDSAKAAEEHLGKVTDTVSYTGLDTTKTYTVVGRLMDVTDEANETIVVQTSKEFRPYSANGSVDVEFGKVDLTAGHRYVVYEYLYTGEIPDQEENDKKNELPKDETPTAEHHDQHDKSQTFVTVEIHTTVGVDGTKSTSDNELTVDYAELTDQKGHVVDTVSYTGLNTSKTYTVVGRLMDVTDEDSETIVAQASKVFQPTETDGSVDVDFGEVALESGHTYVVYEYLYTGEIPDQEENDKKNELPKDETPTAEHHDKHDKSQTFTTTEITSVPVEKKWAEGVSGEEAVIVLVKNGEETDQTITLTEENSWKGTFENLPKYDENGNEISYSVTERTDTYNYTVESDNKGGYIVTNSDKPVETVEIPVEKKWADGASGEEAVIVLVKNGAETTQALVLTEENNWKGSFKNLPKYDDSGKEIEYSVTEKTNSYNYQVDGTQETGFVVTNSPKTEKISIPVKKEWADESNTSAVTFELLRNGTSIKTITLDAGNNWSGSFDNLDKTDSDENEYTYTVRETGYWVNVQTVDEASGTVTVKNVYLPQTPGEETTDLSVYKKWAAGLEKEAVTVQLLQNGEAVEGGTVTLSADNNWSCSFDNLPKYDENGNEYLYSVEEIGGKWLYELTWNSDGSITITNRERNTASSSSSTSSSGSNLSGSSSTTGIGSPKTGDSSNIAAYITLLIAAAAGVLILVSEKRRKK